MFAILADVPEVFDLSSLPIPASVIADILQVDSDPELRDKLALCVDTPKGGEPRWIGRWLLPDEPSSGLLRDGGTWRRIAWRTELEILYTRSGDRR